MLTCEVCHAATAIHVEPLEEGGTIAVCEACSEGLPDPDGRSPIVTPLIHSNGDRRETLVQHLRDAYTAVRAAQRALHACAPNGRNFYPEPGRFERYQAQHRQREDHLHAIAQSLCDEAAALDEGRRA